MDPTGTRDPSRAEPESVPVAITDPTSLVDAFENTLDISQDVEPTESAASEEDSREKTQQEDGQEDGQRDEGGDGQTDGQTDGQAVHPPAAESSSTESKWAVGAQCRAVWSEDGRMYPATVVSLDGERCRVRFNGYGNQEDVELKVLQSPDAAAPPPTRQSSLDWRPGSRCRAVYSEDSQVYPAVVLWVKGQRCRVRFEDYNNEEELDISNLLQLDELHGPSRVKGSNWKPSGTSSNLDWKRRREENQGERGGGGERRRREENQWERGGERRSAWRDEEQNSSREKERSSPQTTQREVEKEAEEKKRGNQQAEKPANHSFSFFPPFPPPPPPPQSGSGEPVSFIPPPPPLWSAGGDSLSSMLMLWYMCGFHTGSYLAQQMFKSNSKD